MECPRCGRASPDGAAECSDCGARLSGAAEAPPGGSDARTIDLSEAPTAVGITPLWSDGLPASASTPALHPGQRLGERYEILSILGEGGCGIVYKAHDLALDRIVALKTIHPSVAASPSALERFKREILLASKITHGNVVRIHDLGQAEDVPFISMEFIEGTDLKQLIQRDGPFGVDAAIPLIRQLAGALRAAHAAGVVHRDLKPQNVLVDPDGHAYIGDFGISRSLDHGQTMTAAGTVLGTLSYMSPEQARGEALDHRSDIYSLGLILYEMFLGDEPFRSDNAVSALMKRVEQDVPAIDATRTDLPTWLSRIVTRCLERKVEDRYQSLDELIHDLDRQHAARTVHRATLRRLSIGAVALALIGALSVVGVRWWGARTADPATETPVVAEVRASLTVAPFGNATADPEYDWIRTGLPELLRSELQQTQSLRLAGRQRVGDVVEGLKLGRDGGFGGDAVLTLARLTDVENVLTGELFRVGDQFRIDAHLLRIGASAIAQDTALRAEGRGQESLFAMVDELSRRVRQELRLDRERTAGRRKNSAELSTSSVEALRLYSEGLTRARAGGDLEAKDSLVRALDADPQFGLAAAMLAETYVRLGRREDAIAAADRASAALSRVSPVEAARIRAVRARLAGDADGAAAAYSDLTSLAPGQPEAYVARASFEEESGDLDGALASLDRAIELDAGNPAALFARGRVRSKRGDAGEALGDFNGALALHIEAKNSEGRATVLNGLGNVQRLLGQPELALRSYRESLGVREELGDRRGVAVALGNIALIQFDMGDLDSAVESLERSLAVNEEIGDDAGRAEALGNLGDLYAASGQTDRALEMYRKSLDTVVRAGGDDAGLARAQSNLGYIFAVLGRYSEAFMYQRDALEKTRALGVKDDILFSLMDIGSVELVLGQFDRALVHYDEGLGLARQVGNQAALIVFGRNIGIIRRERGEYVAALESIDEAARIARDAGDKYHLAECLSTLANTRIDVGDLDGAGQAANEALELSREVGSLGAEAEALTGLGRLLLARGRAEEAIPTLEQATEAAESSQEHRLQLLARLSLAAANASVPELEAVVAEARASSLRPVESLSLLALARTQLSARRFETAATRATEALEVAEGLRQRGAIFGARAVAMQALHGQGRTSEAAHQAEAGIAALNEMRVGLEGGVLRGFLERPTVTTFADTAEQALQAEGKTEALRRLRAALDR